MERVHTYGGPGRQQHRYPSQQQTLRRDPRLLADPVRLPMDYEEPRGKASRAYGSTNAASYGTNTRATVIPEPSIEQYCLCARTEKERRLLVAVLVLSLVCLLLLAALASVVPIMSGDPGCKEGDVNCEKYITVLSFVNMRLAAMMA